MSPFIALDECLIFFCYHGEISKRVFPGTNFKTRTMNFRSPTLLAVHESTAGSSEKVVDCLQVHDQAPLGTHRQIFIRDLCLNIDFFRLTFGSTCDILVCSINPSFDIKNSVLLRFGFKETSMKVVPEAMSKISR